jgi:hypothetical protein
MTLSFILAGIVLLYVLLLVFTWGLCRAASMHPNNEKGE